MGALYHVYLVDDEPLALAHIEKTFSWQEHGFEVAGHSTDPQVARGQILAMSPDVVFTDIQMGTVSGLDLIEQLRAEGCGALYVVVSAYDRFEYARKLMRMEGFDYLIKPVEPTQGDELLQSLRARLDTDAGKKQRPATMSSDLNQILAHLERNYMHKQSLQQIAKQFCISPNYICRLFSKHLDTTFSSHLTKMRMERAAEMLRTTEKTVKEVSTAAGYDDYFYFCRVFREAYGCTPTQYRSRP